MISKKDPRKSLAFCHTTKSMWRLRTVKTSSKDFTKTKCCATKRRAAQPISVNSGSGFLALPWLRTSLDPRPERTASPRKKLGLEGIATVFEQRATGGR